MIVTVNPILENDVRVIFSAISSGRFELLNILQTNIPCESKYDLDQGQIVVVPLVPKYSANIEYHFGIVNTFVDGQNISYQKNMPQILATLDLKI